MPEFCEYGEIVRNHGATPLNIRYTVIQKNLSQYDASGIF